MRPEREEGRALEGRGAAETAGDEERCQICMKMRGPRSRAGGWGGLGALQAN